LLTEDTSSITYPHAILGTVFLVIQKKSQSSDADLPSYIETLVPMLLNRIVVPATIPSPKTKVLCSREVIHVVGLIVNVIVRVADVAAQNAFYKELFKLFVSGEPSTLISSNQEEVQAKFRPLASEVEDSRADTVQIFVSAIAAARKEVRSPLFLLMIGRFSSCRY
jgi:RNAPII transcription regulator C-terminal